MTVRREARSKRFPSVGPKRIPFGAVRISNELVSASTVTGLNRRIFVQSVLSVEAGSTRPTRSLRGSLQSVTSQPPEAWMRMKNSSCAPAAAARACCSGRCAASAAAPRPAPVWRAVCKRLRREMRFMGSP